MVFSYNNVWELNVKSRNMEKTKTKNFTIDEVQAILSNIIFAEYSMMSWKWDFQVGTAPSPIPGDADLFLIRTSFWRKDVDTGEFDRGWGRWHTTPIDSSEKAIVMTGWVAIKMIIEHELLEGFEYKGKKVFDPHKSLEALVYPKTL
jgi:hypothetical protein